ncbi:MAG: Ig-like domain-containing protein, partial [Trueperaceae bacterium]|nr:Ig-like domain-containing protein [Trueperaceae bacterium]
GVTWRSSDPSVATVDADGVVTAVAPGDVTVSATSVATPGLEAGTRLGVLASGEVAWTWQLGTDDDDVGHAVAVAPDGTLLLAGGLRTWTTDATPESGADARTFVAGIAPETGVATFVTTDADPLGRHTELWDVAVVPEGLLAAGVTISSTSGGVRQTQGVLQRLDAAGDMIGDTFPLSDARSSGAFAVERVGPEGLLLAGSTDASTGHLTRTTAALWSTTVNDVEDVATVSPTASPSGTDVTRFDSFSASYLDVAASVEDDLVVTVGRTNYEDAQGVPVQRGYLQAFDLDGTERLSNTDVAAGFGGLDSIAASGVVRLPDGRYAAVASAEAPGITGEEQVAMLALYDPAAPAGTSPVDAYLVGSDADNAFPMAVALLATGELVIVGQSDDPLGAAEGSGDPPAGFVAVVDVPETGAPELLRSWQVGVGSDTTVLDVAVTDDGWLVLAGETEGSLDRPNAGGSDAFLQLVAP